MMEVARDVAWAVTRTGCIRAQIVGDFESLAREVERTWASLFPRRLGYVTRTEIIEAAPDAAPRAAPRFGQAVRLHVRRGDFEGHVELCCDWKRCDAVLIRALASARSQRLTAAQAAGERVIRRARVIATSIGGVIGAGFCWLAAGVQMPVVGGLMLSVITASLLIGGGNLGARVGEGMAARRRQLAAREVDQDVGVQADLRRWNSLNRKLRSHRRALARGLQGGPFRRPALEA